MGWNPWHKSIWTSLNAGRNTGWNPWHKSRWTRQEGRTFFLI